MVPEIVSLDYKKANALSGRLKHRHDEAIGVTSCLELPTEPCGRVLVGNRSDSQPIPDTLQSEVCLLHHGPVISEERRIFVLHVCEGCQGLICLEPTCTTYWLGDAGMDCLGGAACAGAAGNGCAWGGAAGNSDTPMG